MTFSLSKGGGVAIQLLLSETVITSYATVKTTAILELRETRHNPVHQSPLVISTCQRSRIPSICGPGFLPLGDSVFDSKDSLKLSSSPIAS